MGNATRRQTLAGITAVTATAMMPGTAPALSAITADRFSDLYDAALDEDNLRAELHLQTRVKGAMRRWRLSNAYTLDEAAELLDVPGDQYADYEKPAEIGDFQKTREVKYGVPLLVVLKFCNVADTDFDKIRFDTEEELQAHRLRIAVRRREFGLPPFRNKTQGKQRHSVACG